MRDAAGSGGGGSGGGGGGGMDGAISHNIQGLNKTNISDNFYVSQALQCGHLATDCCSHVSRKKCDATQVLIPPFVSAESLMSAAQIYFRMELGTLIAKRALGKSHYVYNCADGLLKGQDIVTDAGAQRRVG